MTGTEHHDQPESQKPPPGIGIPHSISPNVPCPETVLVVVMTDGSYLLVGYPQGEPAAFLVQDDAGLLRQALEAAFGSPEDEGSDTTSRNENSKHTSTRTNSTSSMSTGTIPAESEPEPISTRQAQP